MVIIETFPDLLKYIRDLQKDNPEFYRSAVDAKFGTVAGIVRQFQQLNLAPEARTKDEVMVVFYVKNIDGGDEPFKATNLWFDKGTQDVVAEPQWFKDRKAEIAKAREKLSTVDPKTAN